jgi:hypothetical protein
MSVVAGRELGEWEGFPTEYVGFAAAEPHVHAVVAHVFSPAAPTRHVLKADALFDDDCWSADGSRAARKGWSVPQPAGAVLLSIAVQTYTAVGGEVVKIWATVDDAAGPDEGVRVREGDGAGLVPCNGSFNVGMLRGEFAAL